MTATTQTRPPLPTFTRETAAQKVRLAEDAGNWSRSYGTENWDFDDYPGLSEQGL